MDFNWFVSNGCELAKPDPKMLAAIYALSGGKPCVGCNCQDTCPAWPKVPTAAPTQRIGKPVYRGFNVCKKG